MVNCKLHLYFPGWVGWLRRLCGGLVAEAMWWVGVVIIELKANLSSTSHLTSQLELSLAIREWAGSWVKPNFYQSEVWTRVKGGVLQFIFRMTGISFHFHEYLNYL